MPNFVSFAASVAELAHGENRVLNQSLTHSSTLFDGPGTEVVALRKILIMSLINSQRITLMFTGGREHNRDSVHN